MLAVFILVSKVFSSFTSLCDWSTKFAPVSQPIRSKTKTNHASLARVFPRLAPVACSGLHEFASSSDWFIMLFTCVVIGQSNYFGFGFTTLN